MNTEQVQEGSSQFQTRLTSEASTFILKILGAIILVIVLIMIGKLVAGVVKRNIIRHGDEANSKHTHKVASLIGNVVFYVMVIFAFFLGFESMGFNVGLILWWISFGVWLAFKQILGNMIAGMMILYTKELKLGDIVEIEGKKTYFGRIEEITIRYTVIRTLDLRQVVIPNMTLITAPIKTFSAEEIIKLKTYAYIHYETDIEFAKKVIRDSINSFDFIREKDSTKVFVGEVADSEIVLTCIFFFDPNGWLLADYVVGYINEAIIKAFDAHGINMAYPHMTLTFESDAHKKAIQHVLGDDYKKEHIKL
jgi:small-conductance mechanosensitive channel